jgi:uncharacterized Ntn-hydrolase superfamily protein
VTLSIVACDIRAEAWGVAVASRSLAIGAVVPWSEPGVGAVATQALTNVTYGAHGLALIGSGSSAREALDQIVAADPGRDQRQAGIVDARGRSASHTGSACLPWAGGRSGRGYAAQGDQLAGPSVVDAMASAFEESEGPLAHRLLGALRAGDEAGGDRRGRQSAALRVAQPDAGFGGSLNVPLDLRVDDHSRPVDELTRLLALYEEHTGPTPEEARLPLETELLEELRTLLVRAGEVLPEGLSGVTASLRTWVAGENLGARWWDQDTLDPVVLDRLRAAAASKPAA